MQRRYTTCIEMHTSCHCRGISGRIGLGLPAARRSFVPLVLDDSLPGPGPSSVAAAAARAAASAGQFHSARSRLFVPGSPPSKNSHQVARRVVPRATASEAASSVPGASTSSRTEAEEEANQVQGSGASEQDGGRRVLRARQRRHAPQRAASPEPPLKVQEGEQQEQEGGQNDGIEGAQGRPKQRKPTQRQTHRRAPQLQKQQPQQPEQAEQQQADSDSESPKASSAGKGPSGSGPATSAAGQRSTSSGPSGGGRAPSGGARSPAGPAAADTPTPDGPDGGFSRLPDGRQVVVVNADTVAAYGAGALSRALGREGRAVVRFNGGPGGLKGLRILTLANIFMGQFNRALSCVVDVAPLQGNTLRPRGETHQAGDVSFSYRVMARARGLEGHEARLMAALRKARFFLDLSINVRQAWDAKGDVDEEQAYDLADTFYAALMAQQADEDAEEEARSAASARSGPVSGSQAQGQGVGRAAAAGGAAAAAVAAAGGFGGDGRRATEAKEGREVEVEGAAATAAAVGSRRSGPQLPPPEIFVTADLAQGLTTFTGLGLLQRRLRQERQQAVVEVTIYRCSVSAPRLDGRDGWVFAIRLGFEEPYLPRSQYKPPSYTSAGAASPGGAREPAARSLAAAR